MAAVGAVVGEVVAVVAAGGFDDPRRLFFFSFQPPNNVQVSWLTAPKSDLYGFVALLDYEVDDPWFPLLAV